MWGRKAKAVQADQAGAPAHLKDAVRQARIETAERTGVVVDMRDADTVFERTLAEIKAEPRLANLLLVRQSRLSIVPVGDAEWKILCRMAGLDA